MTLTHPWGSRRTPGFSSGLRLLLQWSCSPSSGGWRWQFPLILATLARRSMTARALYLALLDLDVALLTDSRQVILAIRNASPFPFLVGFLFYFRTNVAPRLPLGRACSLRPFVFGLTFHPSSGCWLTLTAFLSFGALAPFVLFFYNRTLFRLMVQVLQL